MKLKNFKNKEQVYSLFDRWIEFTAELSQFFEVCKMHYWGHGDTFRPHVEIKAFLLHSVNMLRQWVQQIHNFEIEIESKQPIAFSAGAPLSGQTVKWIRITFMCLFEGLLPF